MFPLILSLIALTGIGIIAFGIWRLSGKLRLFVILTGSSIVGFLIAVLLHNVLYGIFILWFGADFWDKINLADEPVFFFIAVFICPLAFLVGVIGSVVLVVRNRLTG